MDAKFYECDNELETLIRNQGWVETTDERDKLKGKKEFRQATKARMLIRFDYINLVVFENSSGCHGIGGSILPQRTCAYYSGTLTAPRQIEKQSPMTILTLTAPAVHIKPCPVS